MHELSLYGQRPHLGASKDLAASHLSPRRAVLPHRGEGTLAAASSHFISSGPQRMPGAADGFAASPFDGGGRFTLSLAHAKPLGEPRWGWRFVPSGRQVQP